MPTQYYHLPVPRWMLVVVLFACALASLGCESDPSFVGRRGGRLDPYQTGAADRQSSKASIPAMLEFSDQVAEELAVQLADIPEITEATHRQILELGSIDNKTRTPTTDFMQIQRRLRSKLLKSRLIRNNFKIVESRRRMDREFSRIRGQEEDLLQEGTSPRGSAKYDAGLTYVLQGDFYESNRGNKRLYYFNFKLTNLRTREIVFDSDFDLGQATE